MAPRAAKLQPNKQKANTPIVWLCVSNQLFPAQDKLSCLDKLWANIKANKQLIKSNSQHKSKQTTTNNSRLTQMVGQTLGKQGLENDERFQRQQG